MVRAHAEYGVSVCLFVRLFVSVCVPYLCVFVSVCVCVCVWCVCFCACNEGGAPTMDVAFAAGSVFLMAEVRAALGIDEPRDDPAVALLAGPPGVQTFAGAPA